MKIDLKNPDTWLFFLFCVYVFFIPISTAGLDAVFSIMLCVWIYKKIHKPDFRFLKDPLFYCLGLFILLSLFSSFYTTIAAGKSMKILFLRWLKFFLLFTLAQDTFTAEGRKARLLVKIFAALSALVIADGIFQQFFGFDFIRHKTIELGRLVMTASFQSAHMLSTYLNFILVVIIALVVQGKCSRKIQIFFITTGILAWLTSLFIFSRGACLGLLIALFLMAVCLRRLKVFLALTAASCLVAGILIVTLTHKPVFSLKSGHDAARVVIWPAAAAMIKDRPLTGHGLGSFTKAFPKYSTAYAGGAPYAHNSFLHIGAETGLLALGCFMAFIVLLLTRGIAFCRKNQDAFVLGLTAALLGFTVHSFFDNHFLSLQLSSLFWPFAGILNALCLAKESQREEA